MQQPIRKLLYMYIHDNETFYYSGLKEQRSYIVLEFILNFKKIHKSKFDI